MRISQATIFQEVKSLINGNTLNQLSQVLLLTLKKNTESSLMENFKMLIPKNLSKLYPPQQKKFYPQFL